MSNRRGLGRHYQRGAIWWVQYSHRGRKVRETSGSTNEAKAVKLLKKRLGEMGQGRLVGPDPEKIALKKLKAGLEDDYSINGRKSTERAKSAIGHVIDYFGENCRALDVTADRINTYVKHRQEEKAAPATIKYELAVFRRALNLAVRAGLLPHRAVFPVIQVHNARQGFFEEAEFRSVRSHLPSDIGDVTEFMYLTGWRRGEVLSLQWRQVDFAAGVVRLEPGTTKNDEGRTFPFKALPDLETLLNQRRQRTTAVEQENGAIVPWVFHRDDAKPIRDFRSVWESACVDAGLASKIKDEDGNVIKIVLHRIVHDFRRTAVRNLERAGVPRSVAMKLTGHKTEAVYRRYAIVSEADLSEGVGKLAKLHQSTPPQPSKVSPFPATGTEGAQSRG